MTNTTFIVPKLKDLDCWKDMRHLQGGYGWRGGRPLSTITSIITHHTVTDQYQNAAKEFSQIWRDRKYGGTAYHFLISSEVKNGYAIVGYMGDVGSIRAHATNEKSKPISPPRKLNNSSIGISFIGDHTKKMPKPEMLRSAKLLIDELIRDGRFGNLKSYKDVYGHGYSDKTWCPDGKEGNELNPLIFNNNIVEEYKQPTDEEWKAIQKWQGDIKRLTGIELVKQLDKDMERVLRVTYRNELAKKQLGNNASYYPV